MKPKTKGRKAKNTPEPVKAEETSKAIITIERHKKGGSITLTFDPPLRATPADLMSANIPDYATVAVLGLEHIKELFAALGAPIKPEVEVTAGKSLDTLTTRTVKTETGCDCPACSLERVLAGSDGN